MLANEGSSKKKRATNVCNNCNISSSYVITICFMINSFGSTIGLSANKTNVGFWRCSDKSIGLLSSTSSIIIIYIIIPDRIIFTSTSTGDLKTAICSGGVYSKTSSHSLIYKNFTIIIIIIITINISITNMYNILFNSIFNINTIIIINIINNFSINS